MATKVLIVDYEPKRITEVSNHLAGLAVEILSARDGIAAVESFHQLAPDLVILCAMLPKKHGFQVCQEIKADPRGAQVPVIIHSSVYKGTKHRLDALNTYGASEFLEYPFTRETLMAAVLKLRPELDGGTPVKPAASDSSSSATMQMMSPFATVGIPGAAAAAPEVDTAKIKPADLAAAVGATGASITAAAAAAKKKANTDLDKLLEDTLSGVRKASKPAAPKPAIETAPAPAPVPPPPPLVVAPPPAPVAEPAKPVAPAMPEPSPEPTSIPATLRETVRSRPINTADLEKKLNDTLSGLRASNLSKKTTTGSIPVPAALAAPVPVPAPVPPIAPPPPAPDAAATKTEVLSVAEKKKTSGVFKSPPGPTEIRLGNFVLGERIATGGMAELFKARQRGVDGFEKTVAIKRILPHLATNAEFTTMFIDEAKLASQLNHPNIAQIYDLGKTDGAYYIAMEYVDGKDLREINRVMVEHHGHFTPAGAGAIVAKILAALSHAHAKKDENGRSLKLVHRDVSPQNILINGDGEIKLVDFGIAKAAAKTQNTQSGALKGKLLYMSPEQAWGRPDIDNRSDLYSAGIILWELLAGRRLYNGDSEMGILDKVREALVPDIREFNPDVSLELAEILNRALAKERDDRYGDARQFQNELEAQLTQEYGEAPSSVWVLSALHGLFPTAYRHDGEPRPVRRPPSASLRKAAAPQPQPPPPPQAPVSVAASAPEPEAVPAPAPKPKTKIKAKTEPAPRSAPPAASAEAAFGGSLGMEPPTAKKSPLPLILGGVGLAAVIGIGIVMMKGKGSSAVSVAGSSVPVLASTPLAASAGSSVTGSSVAAVPSAPAIPSAPQSAPKSAALSAARSAADSSVREKAAAEKAAAEKAAAEKAAAEKAAADKAAADKAAADKAAADKAAADRAAAETASAAAAKTVKPGDFVAYSQLDREPAQISKPNPQIPGAAASKNLSGMVIVSITIDEKGQVINASLVRGLNPDYGVNQSCVEAARKMKFTPGIKDGVPVKTTKSVSYPLLVGGG